MKNHSKPGVSVIIPAYNAASAIGATLKSVFAQTFPVSEVIVVNDGSADTDELEKVLDGFSGRIVYLKQENLGPAGARNAGILKANEDFVAFLDSDDEWYPDFVRLQIDALQKNPSFDLIYSDALLAGEDVPPGLTFMKAAPSRGAVVFESLLTGKCSIITSCVLARKAALISIGLFDPSLRRSEDLHLWLRLAHAGYKITLQRNVLARRMVRHGGLSADTMRLFESKLEVFKMLEDQLELTNDQLSLLRRESQQCEADMAFHRGKRYFELGSYDQAIKEFRLANLCYHSLRLRAVILGLRLAPSLLRRWYHLRQENVS